MWTSLLVVTLAAAPAAAPAAATSAAPADEAPPVGLLAGAATAILPLIAGGLLLAHDQSPRLEASGVIAMASGFALAPWVAHGVEGSWRRAAIYGGVTTALAAGAVVAMEASDAFDPRVGNDHRIPMKILLPLSMASAGFGVIMSVFDRRGLEPVVPRLSLWVAPAAGGLATGLGWGTSL